MESVKESELSRTDRSFHRGVLPFFLIVAFSIWGAVVMAESQDPAPDPSAGSTPATKPQMETAHPEKFPEVVAKVNGTPIGKTELLTFVETVRDQMHIPQGDLPIAMYRDVLDEMVKLELLYQSSRANNLLATPEEVDKTLSDLKEQYASEDAFDAQLKSESISLDSLKEILAKNISIQKLVEGVMAKKVVVTEDAKRQFYAENETEMEQPEHLKLRHILVRVPEKATEDQREQARQKIEGLRAQITEQGADFATLARENSDDPGSRNQGGELTLMQGQAAPQFEEAAFQLQPGEISGIVQTSFGYHIIQLLERIPARTLPYEEVQERIEQYLRREALEREVKEEVGALRSKAAIAIFI
jgi:peptidyl-prolyl cis-trans isomerase C